MQSQDPRVRDDNGKVEKRVEARKKCDKNLKIKNHKLARIIAHKNFSKWSIHHRNRRYLVDEDHKN